MSKAKEQQNQETSYWPDFLKFLFRDYIPFVFKESLESIWSLFVTLPIIGTLLRGRCYKIDDNGNLELKAQEYGNNEACELAEFLKNSISLTKLNLTDNEIGDEGAQALAEALKINRTLRILDLADNDICDDGIRALAEALKVNRSLVRLDLSGNVICDGGARALAEALEINRSLLRLDLSGNDIGTTGATVLAKALTVNSSLVELDLSANSMGVAGEQAIKDMLSTNQNLMLLNEEKTPNYKNAQRIARCLLDYRKSGDGLSYQLISDLTQRESAVKHLLVIKHHVPQQAATDLIHNAKAYCARVPQTLVDVEVLRKLSLDLVDVAVSYVIGDQPTPAGRFTVAELSRRSASDRGQGWDV